MHVILSTALTLIAKISGYVWLKSFSQMISLFENKICISSKLVIHKVEQEKLD